MMYNKINSFLKNSNLSLYFILKIFVKIPIEKLNKPLAIDEFFCPIINKRDVNKTIIKINLMFFLKVKIYPYKIYNKTSTDTVQDTELIKLYLLIKPKSVALNKNKLFINENKYSFDV